MRETNNTKAKASQADQLNALSTAHLVIYYAAAALVSLSVIIGTICTMCLSYYCKY